MKENVYKLIGENVPNMSKAQKKIAVYMLENPHSAPFLTVGKLAKMAGVSEATVVRFATFLGYKGYNELQQHMYDSVEKQLNTVERLQMSRSIYHKETEKGIYEIFEDDMANIQTTMENLDLNEFETAAHYLLAADRIFIACNRSAVSLGAFLHYYLKLIFDHSEMVHSSESAFDSMYDLNEKDVVVGLSFARYTRSTVDIVSHAEKQGAKIIAITDSHLSPVTQFADVSLIASSKMPSFMDSFVAPLSLINAFIAYIGQQQPQEIDKRLKQYEQLWDRYDVFY